MNKCYFAIQNGIILDVFDTKEEALDFVNKEKEKDFLTIMFTKKLRKIFKKSGNVALHTYSVATVEGVEDIK